MGLSLDNVTGAQAELMELEEVELEFVEDTAEGEFCSDVSMELDFTQIM